VSSPKRPYQLWVPHNILVNGQREILPLGTRPRRVAERLLRQVSRLRMSGTIIPILHTPSRSSQVQLDLFTRRKFGDWLQKALVALWRQGETCKVVALFVVTARWWQYIVCTVVCCPLQTEDSLPLVGWEYLV
jgi:hypothetical protein